jgi:hypothetical protein
MDSCHLDGFETAGYSQQLSQEECPLGHHIPERESETRNKLVHIKIYRAWVREGTANR